MAYGRDLLLLAVCMISAAVPVGVAPPYVIPFGAEGPAAAQ